MRREIESQKCKCNNVVKNYRKGRDCNYHVGMKNALSSSDYLRTKICNTSTCGMCVKDKDLLVYYNNYAKYKSSLVTNNCLKRDTSV